MLEHYLQQFIEEFSLQTLAPPDDKKRYRLHFGALEILLSELTPGVYVYGLIGPVPALKREELFIYLMKANFLGLGTGGAVIGLKEDESFLTLSLALPYDINYRTFKETLETFANFLEFWQKELKKHQAQASVI